MYVGLLDWGILTSPNVLLSECVLHEKHAGRLSRCSYCVCVCVCVRARLGVLLCVLVKSYK